MIKRPELKGRWKSYLVAAAVIFIAILILWRVVPELTSMIDGIWNVLTLLVNALIPVGWSVVIAYLLSPLASWLERRPFSRLREKTARGLSTAVIALLIVFTVVSLSVWALPRFIMSATEAGERLPAIISPLIESSRYGQLIGEIWYEIQIFMSNSVTISAKSLIVTAGEVTKGLMMTVIALYIMHRRREIQSGLIENSIPWLGEKRFDQIALFLKKLDRVFGGYFVGKLLESAAITLLCTAGFYLAGIMYAPLMAILVGVGSLVPYVGPIIGATPAALVTFLETPDRLLPFAIVLAAVFLLDGYLIGPKLIGGRLGIGALGVIIGVTVGGGIAGLWGMILGIPFVAVLRLCLLALTGWKTRRNLMKQEADAEELNITDDIHK